MVIEINFPRGGRKPPPNSQPKNVYNDDYLFGRKGRKEAKKTDVFDEVDISKSVINSRVEYLTRKTLQDGMTILGCIKEIQKVALELSLPYRLSGKVFVNNLSIPYTKILQSVVKKNDSKDYKQLSKLFTIGQCVAAKVLNTNDEKFGIILTMMPQEINSNISHLSIKSGMTLWGAISECEDHGYIVDLGIRNCRAFLKTENCEKESYVVGELLWFCVSKADVTSVATTVMLNTKFNKINDMKVIKEISLDHLLPGMQIDFTISKVLENGLEGKFLNNSTGYIDVRQYDKSSQKKNNFKIDDVIQARVLYIMPITKIVYFTLKSLEPRKREKVKDGTIIDCKVKEITSSGIYIKLLKSESRGCVPLHRINKIKNLNEIIDYKYLNRTYPIKSEHSCRVLNYDFSEQIYICSLEKQLVKQSTIFSLFDLKVGQKVKGEIKEIQSNGLVITVQNVIGFIKNEHICDTILINYNNFKNRLKVGQNIDARVWSLNAKKRILFLTMRPSLLNAGHVLTNYEDAKIGKQFLGVIRQISMNGLLVQFFGEVHGWIRKSQLTKNIKNLEHVFKIGQLVKCTILNCKSKRLTLTMYSVSEISRDIEVRLKLGEHVDVIVTDISDERMNVTVKNTDINAFISISNFSKYPKLAPLLAKLYKPGDEISDLVCINNNENLPALSLRNSDLNENNILTGKNLQINTIFPCSVLTTDYIGINLEASFKKPILVSKENISDNNVSVSDFKINQLIYAKILSVSKTVTASTKLSDVWDYDIHSSVEYFSEYLKDVLRIREHLKSLGDPTASLNLGEIVSGTVISINKNGSYIIELDNGSKGIVQSEHTKANLSINDTVKAIVLWWNFEEHIVDIALSQKLISRINQLQNGVINIPPGATNKSNSHAEVLLIKEDFVLGVLRGAAGKRQLIFFPSKLHPNDFKPNFKNYVVGDYINIQVKKIENGFIIGLLKELIKNVDFKKNTLLKLKRIREKINDIKDQPEEKRAKLEKSTEDKEKKNKNNVSNDTEIQNDISEINESSSISLEENSNSETEITKEENKEIKEDIKKEEKINEETKKRAREEEIQTNKEETQKTKKIKQVFDNESIVLPGAENFWNISKETHNNLDESSDDDEQNHNELQKRNKKKKLTPAERAAAARLEEERIRKIELELADAETKPKTADQFDRLVLANPNNSMLWISYMAFHLEATEIEKARSVARKALNTIEFREEQEKLNVWIALLNLENRYGTKESFATALEEAVNMNDSLTVYLQALNILSESKKIIEFTELLRIVSRKFKQEFKMWTEAAEVCYKCNLKDEARNLMQRSLKSLDTKQHINLLVQFAFMEARHNELERAEALLEKILASYPRRVDIWTSYIDMLIKNDKINIARSVLERAVGQKLPAKKMKTLFSKYVQFENKYGDEEKVAKVRHMAANYVKTALK